MSEWKETTIGDIAEVKTGPFGSALLNAQYITGGTPIITVEHIKDFRISELDYPSVTELDKVRLSSYVLEEGDIVFSRVGSVDLSAIALKENEGWLFSSRMLRVRPNRKKIDPLFFSYYLRLYGVRKYINNIAVGSTMPSINTEILKSIPIFHCGLDEQKEIAKTLSNLDQKITLLHQQNQTLEELAQTLFKRWFVEFEFPNENGEPYKSSGGKMVESELGEIPEGWRVGIATDLFEVKDGTHDSPKQKTEGKKLITSKHLTSFNLKDDDAYLISEEDFFNINKRSKVEQYDILFSMIGTIGLTYFEQNEFIDYAIKNVAIFKTSQNKRWAVYTYLWLTSLFGKHYIAANKSGSTQEYVSLTSLRNLEWIIPSNTTMNAFDDVASSVLRNIANNTKDIQTLTQLRDTLLPKLMSGELRVKI
jgi:type I restriction enzyme S subunit